MVGQSWLLVPLQYQQRDQRQWSAVGWCGMCLQQLLNWNIKGSAHTSASKSIFYSAGRCRNTSACAGSIFQLWMVDILIYPTCLISSHLVAGVSPLGLAKHSLTTSCCPQTPRTGQHRYWIFSKYSGSWDYIFGRLWSLLVKALFLSLSL